MAAVSIPDGQGWIVRVIPATEDRQATDRGQRASREGARGDPYVESVREPRPGLWHELGAEPKVPSQGAI
jgi:hypothetical protein